MKALLCTPFCTTKRGLKITLAPGGGETRTYNADRAGLEGQGSRQNSAAYDGLPFAEPVNDTDQAAIPGASGSGDGGKQIAAARTASEAPTLNSKRPMRQMSF